MTLDHSSIPSLLADLDAHRHRGSVFRFQHSNPVSASPRWELKLARREHGGGVSLCVEYDDGRRSFLRLLLRGGRLIHFSLSLSLTVVLDPPLRGGADSSVDDFLRKRTDDNLRGVFS